MRPCDCKARSEFFDIHPDELRPFLEGFDKLTDGRLEIYHLFRCQTCKQLWIVDDTTRGPMAVRAVTALELGSFDERPYRRELIVRDRGLSGKKCMFAACNNRALTGIVFCVDHAYPRYAVDRTAAG